MIFGHKSLMYFKKTYKKKKDINKNNYKKAKAKTKKHKTIADSVVGLF